MTPEQFAKCREFASCYTTNSDILGLASGMIGGLLDHIDTLTAERDALAKGDAYARRLFTTIAPQCTLLDSPEGVMTQIDNAYAGQRLRAEAAEARALAAETALEKIPNLDTIYAERDAVEAKLAKAEGLLCKFAWYKATIEDLIAARAIANAMKAAKEPTK